MVEYLKTKKRYFNKLKNGVKKGYRKNKKNKTRKMIGGTGRTEQEIIDELKAKRKYEEWSRLGSNFGLTSDTSNLPLLKIRPFKYYDVDGNIVNVSMVTSTYRPDVDNIAVFKFVANESVANESVANESVANESVATRRTEKEIIDELKAKGQYEEWIRLGSNFGLTSNTSVSDVYKNRPARYYDVDGNIVNVSIVSSTYRPGVDNIALFKFANKPDPGYVKQSTFRIEEDHLHTKGLATCTGLAMRIGTKKFMAHLDAVTNIFPIIHAINNEISKQRIEPTSLIPFIYFGHLIDTNDRASSLSLQKAKDICSYAGIPEKNYNISNVCLHDTVRI